MNRLLNNCLCVIHACVGSSLSSICQIYQSFSSLAISISCFHPLACHGLFGLRLLAYICHIISIKSSRDNPPSVAQNLRVEFRFYSFVLSSVLDRKSSQFVPISKRRCFALKVIA